MEPILIGTTDRTVAIWIPDPASTTGAGKTGLVAASLTVTYTRYETDNDVVHTDVTSSLNDLSALTDAHNDWGLKEVSSTLSKGQYRLDIADAVFASGAWYAVVQVTITSGTAAATPLGFRLIAYNELDGVRMGMTALPNAAAEASGGLFTRGTGAGQINQDANGRIDTNIVRTFSDDDMTNALLNMLAEIYASGASSVATGFAGAFYAYATGGTLPPVASVAGAVGSVTDPVDVSAGSITAIQAGLSTLTQTQITGGAYALNSASFAFNAALPLTTQQKADVNAEADTALVDYGALKPTTAGRTLDVSAAGNAGIDWSNIEAPTTTVVMSGTTIGTATVAGSVTGDISGKILGGGSGTITGISVWALDGTGSAIPTVTAIDTQLTTSHGTGSWAQASASSGVGTADQATSLKILKAVGGGGS